MLADRTGPLHDVTIVDCTQALAGPFGTALLADLGADVIKVEPPGGDGFRPLPPYLPDHAHPWSERPAATDYGAPFAAVNRNKRSVVLDLKAEEGKESLLRLCESADALVENLRSGVMDSLGVGYEPVAARNPRIVYGAVRGFGDPRTGASPYADWPCLDVAAQSMGGLVRANDGLVTPAVADIFPGTLMALGLVAAVHQARRTGKGQFFDVAMYDSMLTLLGARMASFGFTGNDGDPREQPSTLVPFGLFAARDGRIAIAAPQPNHWQRLCEAMDRPDLTTDERTRTNGARIRNEPFTLEQINAWTSARSKAEIFQALGGKVPVGPVHAITEIFDDPHVAARGMLASFQAGPANPPATVAGCPIKFAATPTGVYRQPPTLGQHTREVLDALGSAAGSLPD